MERKVETVVETTMEKRWESGATKRGKPWKSRGKLWKSSANVDGKAVEMVAKRWKSRWESGAKEGGKTVEKWSKRVWTQDSANGGRWKGGGPGETVGKQ